jgi:hypothetical protein
MMNAMWSRLFGMMGPASAGTSNYVPPAAVDYNALGAQAGGIAQQWRDKFLTPIEQQAQTTYGKGAGIPMGNMGFQSPGSPAFALGQQAQFALQMMQMAQHNFLPMAGNVNQFNLHDAQMHNQSNQFNQEMALRAQMAYLPMMQNMLHGMGPGGYGGYGAGGGARPSNVQWEIGAAPGGGGGANVNPGDETQNDPYNRNRAADFYARANRTTNQNQIASRGSMAQGQAQSQGNTSNV